MFRNASLKISIKFKAVAVQVTAKRSHPSKSFQLSTTASFVERTILDLIYYFSKVNPKKVLGARERMLGKVID